MMPIPSPVLFFFWWFAIHRLQGRQPERDPCRYSRGVLHSPPRGRSTIPQGRQGLDHGAQHHQVRLLDLLGRGIVLGELVLLL